MNKRKALYRWVSCHFVFLLLVFLCPQATEGKNIEDFAGRTVKVPESVHRICTFSHSFAVIVALAPEKLAGYPFPFKSKPETAAYLPKAVRALKPLSSGPNLNLEQLKATGVDLAIGWNTAAFRRNQLAQLDRVHVPTLLVGVDRLEQYPATFRLLGRALGVAERGEALAAFLEQASDRLFKATARIPPRQRVRVYYTESMDGLTSQCGEAHRAEVIRLAGAINALPCSDLPNYQAIPADIESSNVTLGVETLLKMDPDVIVTRFPETRDIIGKDPRWRRLRAVQKGAIHTMPNIPFNWFDRPPSYMRIMGAQWLAQLLYPSIILVDLGRETRELYRLFFQVDLDDGQINALLGPMNNRAAQP